MLLLIRAFLLFLLVAVSAHSTTWSEAVGKELPHGDNAEAPLAPIYRRAFLENLPNRITHFTDDPKKPDKEIYIGDGVAGVRSSKDWNVIADGTNFYVWRQGESTGLTAPQTAPELFRYLEGLINPTGIMGLFYAGYLQNATAYRIEEKGDVLEYVAPDSAAEVFSHWTFLVQKNPPWLLGFRVINPETKTSTDFRISPPEHVSQIPPSFLTPPKDVKFTPGTINWSRDLIPYL